MLSSIHPLGERARHNRWSVTAAAYLLGSIAGGTIVSAVAATLGQLMSIPGAAASALAAGLVREIGNVTLPKAVLRIDFRNSGPAAPPRRVARSIS